MKPSKPDLPGGTQVSCCSVAWKKPTICAVFACCLNGSCGGNPTGELEDLHQHQAEIEPRWVAIRHQADANDGTQLSLVRFDDPADPVESHLTNLESTDAIWLEWSPGGQHLAFMTGTLPGAAAEDTPTYELWIASADDDFEPRKVVLRDGSDVGSRFDRFAWAGDDTLAARLGGTTGDWKLDEQSDYRWIHAASLEQRHFATQVAAGDLVGGHHGLLYWSRHGFWLARPDGLLKKVSSTGWLGSYPYHYWSEDGAVLNLWMSGPEGEQLLPFPDPGPTENNEDDVRVNLTTVALNHYVDEHPHGDLPYQDALHGPLIYPELGLISWGSYRARSPHSGTRRLCQWEPEKSPSEVCEADHQMTSLPYHGVLYDTLFYVVVSEAPTSLQRQWSVVFGLEDSPITLFVVDSLLGVVRAGEQIVGFPQTEPEVWIASPTSAEPWVSAFPRQGSSRNSCRRGALPGVSGRRPVLTPRLASSPRRHDYWREWLTTFTPPLLKIS